jgi:tetratricopeptide (TPR) repeat protein
LTVFFYFNSFIFLFLIKLEAKLLKNYRLIQLLFFILFFFGCSKKKEEKYEVNSSKDSLSIYFSLANDLTVTLEKRELFSNKAFEVVVNQENDSLNRVNLFKVANRYYNINKWNDYIKTVLLVLEKSESAKDTVNIGKGNSYLGDYYSSQMISDSAFQFYSNAEKIYDEIGDKSNLGKTLINKATLQFKAGDFYGAENTIIKALRKIRKERQVNSIMYDAYNLQGLISNELGDFENAIAYNNKALSVIDDNLIPEQFQSRATSYNNIGYLYLSSKKYLFSKGIRAK